MATISQQLDQYLQAFRERLRKLSILKGSALLLAVLLLVSVATAWWSIRSGFANDVVILSRLLLLAATGFIAYRFIFLLTVALMPDGSRPTQQPQ